MKKFMIESYNSDPVAFWFELIGSIAAIIASAMLAVWATDPPMALIYPFYLASSVLQIVASARRKAAWITILSVYFTFINIYGIINVIIG